MDTEITRYDARIAQWATQSAVCQRLTRVAGVGLLTATAFVAAVYACDGGRRDGPYPG